MMKSVSRGTLLLFLIFLLLGCGKKISESETGVLVLAHGAGKEWNEAVLRAVDEVSGNYQKEVAFGMGDAGTIQPKINALQSRGIKRIVVVPLFLSSSSEMYRHIEYVLGLRKEPDALFLVLMENAPEHTHGHMLDLTAQVKFSVPYRMATAINYEQLIAAILEERIRSIRFDPARTSFFLLAHGPVSEEDNRGWFFLLSRYIEFLEKRFSHTKFLAFTFRDDAPAFIKKRAIHEIRNAAMYENAQRREVIALPFLLAPGGREMELEKILNNCRCRVHRQTLLPHRNISRLIERKVQSALSRKVFIQEKSAR